MPTPSRPSALAAARAALADARGRRYNERQTAGRLTTELNAAVRSGDHENVRRLQGERKATVAALADLKSEIALAAERERAVALEWASGTADPFAELPLDCNIAMLPVRLETRFLPDDRGRDELLVRIYPDDIHVDSHEPELTIEEQSAGHNFHTASAGANIEARRSAWAALAEGFGAPRAAYIAARTVPGAPQAPETRADDWTRGASTAVLPDQWLIAGVVKGGSGFRVWGSPVPDHVQVGPDPAAEDGDEGVPSYANIDPDLAWIENFEAAEEIGLGIRVPARKLPESGRIDLLLALGVKSTLDAQDSRDRLAGVLTAHRYTDDMGFITRGTATNNTEDRRSSFDSRDSVHERSFAAQEAADRPLEQGSNAERLALALGLSSEQAAIFCGLEAAHRSDLGEAEAMISALWPVTWWYYLKEMMGGHVDDDTIEFVRDYFTRWIRPGGWLVSLRLGRQPYGFWPVTDTRSWQPKPDRDHAPQLDQLGTLLNALRQRWHKALDNVPRTSSGADGTDPAENLLAVLGMDGVSRRHYARAANADHFLFNMWGFGGLSTHRSDLDSLSAFPDLANLVRELTGTPHTNLWNPLIRRLFFDEGTLRLTGARIANAATGPASYIDWMLQVSPQELTDEAPYAADRMPLLYLLLRHAARLEYGRTAANLVISAEAVGGDASFEPIMVNFSGAPSRTYASVMEENVPSLTGTMTFAEHMGRYRTTYQQRDEQFNAFWQALEQLQGIDDKRLDVLLRETLDLSAHRLDAVLSGLANQRFHEVAETETAGPFIGGFGWLENLSKSTGPRSHGHILAPGIDHATSAAVLRAGHLAHRKEDNPNAMAVNLTSARVRIARAILDGVASGLPLGAVLGYRFERMLHEHPSAPALDRYILPFRQRVPLAGMNSPDKTVAVGQVVDGYTLHQRHAGGEFDLDFVETQHRNAVRQVLDELGYMIDAVGDALLAEGMFQTIRGNQDRTRSTLDAIARGDASPPELEFARSIRRAVAFRHRIVISLTDTASDWPTHNGQVRRLAEPRLDAWLATQLPSPDQVGVTARAADNSWPVSLVNLNLTPLDLFHISVNGYLPGSEIHTRFLAAARAAAPQGLAMLEIELDLGHTIGNNPPPIPFSRLSRQLDALRAGLDSARHVAPHEIAAADQPPADTWDKAELRARVDALVAALDTRSRELDPGAATLDLVTQLWGLRAFGLAQSLPVSDDPVALREQAIRLQNVVAVTIDRLEKTEAAFDRASASSLETIEHDLARSRMVLGEGFLAIPRFGHANPAEYSTAVSASNSILGPDAAKTLPIHRWLSAQARVQPTLGRLNAALNGANRLRQADTTPLAVLQFPVEENARWCALPLDGADVESYANKDSIVVLGELPQTTTFAGLSIDAFSESLPLESADGAVAFHLDQPSARAPNVVLLATPPRLGEGWSAETMLSVLIDALEIGKLRTVDNTALDGLGQFLPALLLAANEEDETVSTDIGRAILPELAVFPMLNVFTRVSPT